MKYTKRNCDNCGREYLADNRNLKRGWGLCCSKSCAAKKREKSRPDLDEYTPDDYHNSVDCDNDQWGDCEHGIHD